MSTPSTVAAPSFWRDAATRAARNAVQVLVPVLALAATGQLDSAGVLAVLAAAGLAAAASLLKSMAGLRADPTSPAWVRALDRVAGAAAGAVVGLLPLDLAGALSADWRSIAVAAVGAALLALATWAVTPELVADPDSLDRPSEPSETGA